MSSNHHPYRWLACLGRGSTGEVWAAERDGRILAVKVLMDTRPDSPHAEAIKREVTLGPKLVAHPNIVAVRRVEVFQDVLHLEMDWVRGPSLDQLIEGRVVKGKGPVPAKVATDWADQVLETLFWAAPQIAPDAAESFVHRDIKPANLMVDPEKGRIRITDFGMARAEAELGFMTTQSGIVKGTPRFMAPEVLVERAVDHRADQFSVGVVLYEMLAGQALYKGDNLADVLLQAMQCDVKRQLRNLLVPDALRRILARMLARDPADRFEDHRGAARALRALQPDLPGPPLVEVLDELLADATGPVVPTGETLAGPDLRSPLELASEDTIPHMDLRKPVYVDDDEHTVVMDGMNLRAQHTLGEHVAFPDGEGEGYGLLETDDTTEVEEGTDEIAPTTIDEPSLHLPPRAPEPASGGGSAFAYVALVLLIGGAVFSVVMALVVAVVAALFLLLA